MSRPTRKVPYKFEGGELAVCFCSLRGCGTSAIAEEEFLALHCMMWIFPLVLLVAVGVKGERADSPTEEVNTSIGNEGTSVGEDAVNRRRIRSKRQAHDDGKYPGKRWYNGTVFMFDKNLNDAAKEAFRKAAYLWGNDTCIDFHEEQFREDEEDDGEEGGQEGEGDSYYYEDYSGNDYDVDVGGEEEYGYIFVSAGEKGICESTSVGRNGYIQFLYLGEGCESIGIAAHEIGHALGLYHTHTRRDRNEHVKIIRQHIKNDTRIREQFKKAKHINNYRVPYDPGSIMQYEFTAASFNETAPTIEAKRRKYMWTLGSRMISFYDLLLMNKHYNCTDKCKENITCHNDGIPHPRNCSRCLCPTGYGGLFCNERPSGCGKDLNATANWTVFNEPLDGRNASSEPDGYAKCYYRIQAPEGTKVKVKLMELPVDDTVGGCIYAGVEIKAQEDQANTGYRFCSESVLNTTLTSKSNMLPVITFNSESRTTVTRLMYRFVNKTMDNRQENVNATDVNYVALEVPK